MYYDFMVWNSTGMLRYDIEKLHSPHAFITSNFNRKHTPKVWPPVVLSAVGRPCDEHIYRN